MGENRYDTGRVDNSKFTFQDLVELVVDKWYYFVLSILLFISAGVLYILSTPPTYQREATIMVKVVRAVERTSWLCLARLQVSRHVEM